MLVNFVMQMLDVSVNCAAVPIRISVFCIVCSFVICVVDAIGDHIVGVFSSIGLVTALYVKNNVSLCLPHLVKERTMRIGMA